jgi:hypothetical protein
MGLIVGVVTAVVAFALADEIGHLAGGSCSSWCLARVSLSRSSQELLAGLGVFG